MNHFSIRNVKDAVNATDVPSFGQMTALIQAASASASLPVVNVKTFGAVGDWNEATKTGTDDSAAFVAAIAYLNSIAGNPVNNFYKASPKLFIPAGSYYMGTTTIDITHTLIIEGEGGRGFGAGGSSTILRWDAGATGIRIQAYNTSGASTVDNVNTHTTGAYSLLRNLCLDGPGVAGTLASLGLSEGEYHGLHVKAIIYCENVQSEGFQGDALYCHTTIGGGSPDEGQSNLSHYYNCSFRNSRNGASIEGGDSNAQVFTSCEFNYNRACGVDDQSFLGNTYIHPHAAGNGISGDNVGSVAFPAYVVSNGGNRYCPVQGQEATASTTAPSGTADTSVWLYLGAGGTATGIPAWVSGMSLRCGAPYRTNNHNAPNSFLNPYEEGGQGYSQTVYPTVIHSGLHGNGAPRGTGQYLGNNQGAYGSFSTGGIGYINPANGAGNVLNSRGLALAPSDGSDNRQWQWFNGDLVATRSNNGGSSFWPFRLTGVNTLTSLGPDKLDFDNGYGFAGQKRFPGTAAPTTGTWALGDQIHNTAPTAGGNIGWVCTAAGSPGTWKTFGSIGA